MGSSTDERVEIQKSSKNQLTMSSNCALDVRVDNWGNYCLQRFHAMYERGDNCDIILQFHDSQIIKAHRLMLNTSTDYFMNLERLYGMNEEGILQIPPEIEYATMLIIIKFFYTGKLEMKGMSTSEVYRSVKFMNISILTKLLEAHCRNSDITPPPPPSPRFVKGGGTQIVRARQPPVSPLKKIPVTRQDKLPPGTKTKTVLARVQPQNQKQNSPLKATTKKLPIWKERVRVPLVLPHPSPTPRLPLKEEVGKPTRFEWPEEEDNLGLSLESNLGILTSVSLSNRKDKYDKYAKFVDSSSIGRREEGGGGGKWKREEERENSGGGGKVRTQEEEEAEGCSNAKIPRLSSDVESIERELAEMEASTIELPYDNSSQDGEETPSLDYSPHLDPPQQPTLVNNEELLNNSIISTNNTNNSTATPILKTAKSTKLPTKSPKSVRFAPELEASPQQLQTSVPTPNPSPSSLTLPPPHSSLITSSSSLPPPSSSSIPHSSSIPPPPPLKSEEEVPNHSKIISEVLKKYPDLVKDNRSIKLKIIQKESGGGGGGGGGGGDGGRSKVSYIVLKSSSAVETDAGNSVSHSTILKKPAASAPKSSFWDEETNVEKKVSNAVNNVTGPWFCLTCGSQEAPITFETYYLYRKHLENIHGEKVDARICEHCGFKNAKRNNLFYHMYTQHGIEPPPSFNFPQCDKCDHVALSETMLNKHKSTHKTKKEFNCHACSASFKGATALHNHMIMKGHTHPSPISQRPSKTYQCPLCFRQFARINNLKAHVRLTHKDSEEVDSYVYEDGTYVDGSSGESYENVLGPQVIQLQGIVDSTTLGTLSVPISIIPSSQDVEIEGGGEGGDEEGDEEYSIEDGGGTVFVLDSSQIVGSHDGEVGGEGGGGGLLLSSMNEEGESDLVQDIHGNKFRKLTGRDSEGNEVLFLQLAEEGEEEGMEEEGGNGGHHGGEEYAIVEGEIVEEKGANGTSTEHMYINPEKCSVFVSSSNGMPMSLSGGETQTLVTYSDGSQVIELLPLSTVTSIGEIEEEGIEEGIEEEEGVIKGGVLVHEEELTQRVEEEEVVLDYGGVQEVTYEEIVYEEESTEEMVEKSS